MKVKCHSNVNDYRIKIGTSIRHKYKEKQICARPSCTGTTAKPTVSRAQPPRSINTKPSQRQQNGIRTKSTGWDQKQKVWDGEEVEALDRTGTQSPGVDWP